MPKTSLLVILFLLQLLSFSLLANSVGEAKKGLCRNDDPKRCRCDPLCHLFRDCCQEVVTEMAKVTSLPPPVNSSSLFHCARPENYGISASTTLYIVNKCPKSTIIDPQKRRMCEFRSPPVADLRQLLPVYSTNDGLLYANSFCAECNQQMTYTFPPESSMMLSCQSFIPSSPAIQNSLEEGLLRGDCHFDIALPDDWLRTCFLGYVSSCPDNFTGSSVGIIEGCEKGAAWYQTYPVRRGRIYKNFFCCLCHQVHCTNSLEEAYQGNEESQHSGLFRYNLLMNFNNWKDQEVVVETGNDSTLENLNGSLQINSTSSVGDRLISVASIITLVCCSLSILSLICLIVFYSLIPDLKNFGGKLVVSLSSILLLSLILFILSQVVAEGGVGCLMFAIFMHCAYLSSFTWMTIFGYDLLRTFRLSRLPSNSGKRFAKFCAVGFGFPLAFSLTAALVNVTADPAFVLSPNYARPKCWFNSQSAGLFWFFVPVSLTVLFNCCLCLGVFCHLYRTARDTIEVQSQSRRDAGKRTMFVLCLKVTVVLGVSWTLQIAAALCGGQEQCPSLTIVSEVATALQGFLIAMCFGFTHRVVQSVRSTLTSLTSQHHHSDTPANPPSEKYVDSLNP